MLPDRVSNPYESGALSIALRGPVQTCLKGSPKGGTKIGCLRQVTPTGSFALHFGSRDPENVAA